MPSLDVIIPSYNRAPSLRRAVESLFRCRRPPGLEVRVIVVDNNSKDDTRGTVAALAAEGPLPVLYVFEARQGQPAAINAGIAASSADLIAFFDDDERAFPDWFEAIEAAFRDPELGFITGRYVPDWLASRPEWLPPQRLGLVGIVDYGEDGRWIRDIGNGLMFLGGNAVGRRTAVLAAGGYSEWLTYGNDAEFGVKLVHAGAMGRYVPELRVHHEIPPGRLSKAYLRRRTMMNHAAKVRIRRAWPMLEPTILGLPYRIAYYRLAALLAGLPAAITGRGGPQARFETELLVWDIGGLLRGWFGLGSRAVMR
jgi:glycosyltransferase involved in cell wall biosynthesis